MRPKGGSFKKECSMNKNDVIEVVEITPLTDRGALKAYVTIRAGKCIINDCRIIKERDKPPWLSMPVMSYKDKYGTTRYRNLIKFEDENYNNDIAKVALAAWQKNGGIKWYNSEVNP